MNTFSKEEVEKSALKYFNNDALAATVWSSKYNLKNDKEEFIENGPIDRFNTIVREIIRADGAYTDLIKMSYAEVLNAIFDKHFLPGGSSLAGIGNEYSTISLGNCFVISSNNEDSYGSIMRNDQEIVQIAKRRGGIGLDISPIRPKGFRVNNAANTTTGVTAFMERFSNSTREVGQDGRRGALMLSCHINHPDILEVITVKNDDTSVTGANVSVKVTDEFMKAVEVDGLHQLRYPVDLPYLASDMPENAVHRDANGGYYINVRARSLFDKIAEVNWKRAEPGMLFWDTIERESPADRYPDFKSESTNPCGEIPLSPYDSCRLLAINLTSFVRHPFEDHAKFDTKKFIEISILVTRVMDNIKIGRASCRERV